MKYLLPILFLVGCSSPKLSPIDQQAVRIHIASQRVKHTQDTNLITMSTQFASICPYCQKVTLSKSTLPSGGTPTQQLWTISYVCPCCHMPFCDSRSQTNPPVSSVRLPIR